MAMDITVDAEHGLHALVPHPAPMQFEPVINLWSLGLEAGTLGAGWRVV